MVNLIRTRLWWTEVARGVVSITFAVLFVVLRLSALRAILIFLGIYLILDVAIDTFLVATRRSNTRRSWFDYLINAGTVVLGVLCFFLPVVSGIILLEIVAVRLVLRGLRTLHEGRRGTGDAAGIDWLSGGAMVGIGVVLAIFPFITLIVIAVVMPIYLFFDGLFMVARGLVTRFRPDRVLARVSHATPEIPPDIAPTARRAIVFVRRTGASGLGHVGWAFEWGNGWFNAGSVENIAGKPIAPPDAMDFWDSHTLDPIATVLRQQFSYDEFKVFYVSAPQPKTAWHTVIWESRTPYSVVRHNCNDVVYDVLRAYGLADLISPSEEIVPNDWYDSLVGTSYQVTPGQPLPLKLWRMSQRELATHEIPLTIPVRIKADPPPWLLQGHRAWEEIALSWDKMNLDVRTLLRFIRQQRSTTKATLTPNA